MENTSEKLPLPENKMGTMPEGRLLFSMAIPMVLSMLVQALYNVVDSVFVSRISESAVTALGLAYPVQNMQIGFALGGAVGVNALLSKSLGEGDKEKANYAAGNGIFIMLITMAIFMLFGVFGARPYYEMQSEVRETVEDGTVYTAICCLLTAGLFTEIMGERLLQASGRTVYTLFTQGTGAVLNIILDPLFIFGGLGIPAMGIAGAAVATVIGQWVAGGLAIYFNLRKNPDVRFALRYLRPRMDSVKPILTVGVPTIIVLMIGSVMTFGMNLILLGFPEDGETAAGVFGVYYKLQSFFFMPVYGINNTTISIIAYNYGARKPKRIMNTVKLAVISTVSIMFVGLAVFELVPQLLIGAFNPSPAFMDIGCAALRAITWHFPVAAVGICLGGVYQGMGVSIYSTIVSLLRQLILLLPAAYLLGLSGDINMVWWSFPISEGISLILALAFFVRIYRRKIRPMYGPENSAR